VSVYALVADRLCFDGRLSRGDVRSRVVEMTGRGRGRRGPPWGRGRGFGSFLDGPGGFPRGPRARRGDIRTAALLLLAEGPRNGYGIMQEIEQRSGGVWRPSPGSVYPALSQLEDEGLIRTEPAGDRRMFVLTDAGRAEVEARGSERRAPWEELSGEVDDDVAALFAELRRVAMAAAQIGHLGAATEVAKAKALLSDVRRSLHALLAADENDD
jgi:DNA-binding PadR family transcriptional regulator